MAERARWAVLWGLVAVGVVWPGSAGRAGEEPAEEPAEGNGSPDLPRGILARVDGREVSVREYADYLLASIGTARLGEYIDRLLLAAEAERKEVIVTPDEVEAMVEDAMERTIAGLYRGERRRYEEALERRGITLEERKAWLRQKLFYDTLLDRLVIAGREVTEEEVREEFQRVHGKEGIQRRLRHILVARGPRIGPDGSQLAPRGEAAAEKRARAILAQLRSGADFVDLARKYSDDTFTRVRDGELAGYRGGVFGSAFDEAVAGLTEGRPLSEVVRTAKGFHIIQYLGATKTEFEDVRERIEEELRLRAPTTPERLALVESLRERADIRR